MNQQLLEKYESLVIDLGQEFMANMQLELGKKYKNNTYELNAGLSSTQNLQLQAKHKVSDKVYTDIYSEFFNLKPTEHMQKALDAFTASGGNVDIEPAYDESSERLDVSIKFNINGKRFKKIEGLSAIEDIILRMNAMLQLNSALSDMDSKAS